MMRRFLVFSLCAAVVSPNFAMAQGGINPDGDDPVEITADESLEWHRNDLYFLARKNVVAVQGDTTLRSQLLTAKYRDGQKGGMDIYSLIAEGGVEIFSAQSKAYGNKAVYDVDKGHMVMTGNNLKLVSSDQTVTARDKFEYWTADGKLIAIGRAVAVRDGDRIEADKMTAKFTEDAKGKRSLKSLEAVGNVVITTPEEVLRGDRATYDAGKSLAQLEDNVKITRGPNVLQGSRAELDTKTNVSKIFGGIVSEDGETGRVRAVFYPGSQKSDEGEEE